MKVVPGRLVLRFALISLAAFVAIGGVLGLLFSRQVREQQEQAARTHSEVLADSLLRSELTGRDLRTPLAPGTAHYRAVLAFVRSSVLQPPALSMRIWGKDGTILFSDDPGSIGKRSKPDVTLRGALSGHAAAFAGTAHGPSSTTGDPGSRKAPKVLSSYIPLYLEAKHGSSPNAVVQIDTDYAGIQAQINRVFRTLGMTVSAGLAVLYLLLLPIVIRAGRALSKQNERLGAQTNRLVEHLQREKQTVRQLTELNEAQGNFVAVASHELRSPLTSIVGYIKTLKRPEFEGNESAQKEFLDAAERQADRLLQLVENLLTASKIEDNEQRLSLVPVEFDAMAADVVEALGVKGERVALALAPNLPRVVTDRQWLELVVANLVNNAIKFSPEEAPCELGARRDSQSLVIWVRDRGIGIPADQIGRIFERFYQADSSNTRRYGGVGLGLSLVKDLVTNLGGEIRVDSELARGSTFTVTLPLVHPEAVIDAAELEEEAPVPAQAPKRRAPVPEPPPLIVASRPY